MKTTDVLCTKICSCVIVDEPRSIFRPNWSVRMMVIEKELGNSQVIRDPRQMIGIRRTKFRDCCHLDGNVQQIHSRLLRYTGRGFQPTDQEDKPTPLSLPPSEYISRPPCNVFLHAKISEMSDGRRPSGSKRVEGLNRSPHENPYRLTLGPIRLDFNGWNIHGSQALRVRQRPSASRITV